MYEYSEYIQQEFYSNSWSVRYGGRGLSTAGLRDCAPYYKVQLTHNRRVFHSDTDCWAEFTCFSTYSNLLSLTGDTRLSVVYADVCRVSASPCPGQGSATALLPPRALAAVPYQVFFADHSFTSRQSPKVISKRYDSILNISSTITSWLFEWSSHLNCQLLDFLNSTRKLLRKVHFVRQRLVLLTVVVGSDTVNWLASENVAQSVLGWNTISPTDKPILRVVYSTLMYPEWSCLVGEFGSDELSRQ